MLAVTILPIGHLNKLEELGNTEQIENILEIEADMEELKQKENDLHTREFLLAVCKDQKRRWELLLKFSALKVGYFLIEWIDQSLRNKEISDKKTAEMLLAQMKILKRIVVRTQRTMPKGGLESALAPAI